MVSLGRTIRAGLLVLAAFGFLSASALAQQKAEPERQAAAGKRADPSPVPAPANSLVPKHAKPYEPACQRPKDQGEKDLCESIRANDLAEENLIWVRIGTVAVVLSLLLTGWAARAAAIAAKAATKSVEHAEADAVQQSARFSDQLAIAQKSADAAEKGAIAAETSADLARTAMELTQRAHMTFAEIEKDCTFDSKGALESIALRLVWQNSGNTPAENVKSCTWVLWAENLPASFDVDERLGDPSAVGAGVHLCSSTMKIDDEAIPDIRTGTTRLFIWGAVEYDDVFSGTPRHRSEYCAVMHLPLVPHRPPSFYNTGPFNGSDGSCLRRPQTPKGKAKTLH